MGHRRLWWLVHQWAGLKLTLLLTFVLATGTLAVLAHEIDWLLRPAMRIDPATAPGLEIAWVAAARTLVQREPTSRLVSLTAPIDPWFSAVALVARRLPAGGERMCFVYLHPATGEYLGTGPWVSVQRVLRDLHRRLMLPTRYGVPLVASLALVMLATFATSFVIYKGWWRGLLRIPRAGRARRYWGDTHRLAGVWSLPFLLLIGITGLWYLIESLGGDAPRVEPRLEHGVTWPAGDVVAALPGVLAAAKRAFPGLRVEQIVFPQDAARTFGVLGQHRAWLVRPRANAVWVVASTGELRAVVDARDLTVHQRIAEMADPLHFGTFGGLTTKLLWFLWGAALTTLAASGAMVYAMRIVASDSVSRTLPTAIRIWRGMGPLRWLCGTLVLLAMGLVPGLFLT
jgi:uncharacterized iron-regulated membrane protein